MTNLKDQEIYKVPLDKLNSIPFSRDSQFFELGLILPYFKEPLPYVTEKERERISLKTVQRTRYLQVQKQLSQQDSLEIAISEAKNYVDVTRKAKLREQQYKRYTIEEYLPRLYIGLLGVDDIKKEINYQEDAQIAKQFVGYSELLKKLKRASISNFDEQSPYVFLSRGCMIPRVSQTKNVELIINRILKNKHKIMRAIDMFLVFSVMKHYKRDNRNYDEILNDILKE